VADGGTSSSSGGKNSEGWTSERDVEFREWLKGRPAVIRAAATAYPPNVCYRAKSNAGHYVIMGYAEPVGDGEVTVRLLHGKDSYGAGHQVFGVYVSDLVPCDCGKWDMASAEDLERSVARAIAILVAPKSGTIH